ncbi:MAG: amino acid adenylation domain-containing protein, partial [bacterium]|nr:amino acid adenylation domain-containing protein [bacterium]
DSLNPVPIEVPGELFVGGAGLARGYLGRPGLSAERFVPSPFGDRGGERLYRTGDRARVLAGGELEYLGRVDQQVKIRGFRIEPGEIETALAEHRAVDQCVVMAREDEPGSKRLVAYWVGGDRSAKELREFLKAKLPEHMVPAAWVRLDAFPLTPHGKVDRRALPAPDRTRSAPDATYVAPRNPIEELLAETWCAVLGLERVGMQDSFFEVGGDSILAIRLLAAMRQSGLDLSLQQLFQYQTIQELGRLVNDPGADPTVAQSTGAFSLVGEEDRRKLPASVEDAYPLTRLQAGMLFHTEPSPETAIYHDIFSNHLKARLDLEAWRGAIAQQIHAHPVLRTSFALTGVSEPLQLVHKNVEIPLEIVDLRHLAAEEQETAIDQWMERERRRAFAWNRAPLLRFALHPRSDDGFQFSLSFHHAIFDGWSVASLQTGLFQLYLRLLETGTSSAPRPPAVTLREYVALERRTLESPECRDYWLEKLAGAAATKIPRHPQAHRLRSGEVGVLQIAIPREVSEGLKALARAAGTPLKSVLLAAHVRVLGLLGNHRDVVTGLVANGRIEREGGERTLGLFLNTLPFRLPLSGGTWTSLVRETFQADLETVPFRRYPLAEIQRLLGGQPLFETAFNYTHFHVYRNLEGATGIEALGGKTFERTNFTLLANFGLGVFHSQVELHLQYDAGELTAEQVTRIGAYYATALVAMARQPSARYELGTLLSEPERHQLLVEWNVGTRAAADGCLHPLFEAWAERTPEAIAAVFADEQLSYGELNRRAHRLAHHLRSLGVGPEVRVGISMERSLEMLTAVLATLKAGGVCVPLDRAYPRERLEFILKDAQAAVVLTQKRLAGECLDGEAGVVYADSQPPVNDPGRPLATAGPENLAYLIYTSGSTGKPKGVAMSHGALHNLMAWQLRHSEVARAGRTLQFTSLNFDVSFQEMFATWGAGGTLVVVSESLRRDASALIRTMARAAVERLYLPFVALQQLAEVAVEGAVPGDLREVITAGEQLRVTGSIRQFFERTGSRLHNQYGPAESHVVTEFAMGSPPRAWPALPPIGRPVAGTSIHLLDAHLLPVPAGVPGELCIGGAALARGYLHRPGLTAVRFVPSPFPGEPGSRLYKSGDLARYLPDGAIEFLGRIDHQVKIRGYRIEPGEVEATLEEHPAVREAVVVVRDEPRGDKRLVAYLVTRTPELGELRGWLRERLPEFMIPSVVVPVEALPLTPSGKVDRAALGRRELPAPDRAGSEDEAFVPPRTPIEKLLARTWSEVLGRERVGLGDDFFALGGHSLVATRVFARLNEALASELPLSLIFDAPELGELAARIGVEVSRQEGGREAVEFLEIPRRARPEAPTPLSFHQERLWVLDRLEPGSTVFNMPFPLRLEGEITVLERSINEIVRRHESLRTTFPSRDGDPVQIISPPAEFRLSVVDLSRLAEPARQAEAEALFHADAATPFDLERGPLYRATLLRLGTREHVLLQNLHHIISDGWSIGVLFRELAALLEAFTAGGPGAATPLVALPIQYADFALWQRERLRGEFLEQQLAYWREQLRGPLPRLELPTDRPRPGVQTYRGACVKHRLPAALRDELHALSREHGASLFITLLAAFKLLLHRYTGQDDIIVGTPIAGRQRLEVEGLIGYFLNSLALRTEVGGGMSFRGLAGRVREVVLGATAHQEVPFEKLLEELRPERHLNHTPIFQVMFNMLNLPIAELELPGLKIEEIANPEVMSKFDLTLYVHERDDEIYLDLVYNVDLFDRARMVEMLAQYAGLLEQITTDPEAEITSYSLLTDAAARLLPQPAAPLAARWEGSIHQGFARQAARRPEGPALIDGGEIWSYGELERRSNQLARYLLAHGVEPGAVVAIWAHRSASLVWALLGILKAGAAFLILDPAYPAARLREYARQARPRGWLEMAAAGEPPAELVALVEELGCCRLRLPSRSAAGAEQFLDEYSTAAPEVAIGAGDPAYVTFTSGSTGVPKGILGHHGPAGHFLDWHRAAFELSPNDRFSMLSGLNHDPLLRDIFTPLWLGAVLVIPDPDALLAPGWLAGWMRREAITVAHLTPAMGRLLAAAGGAPPSLPALRYLFFGGAALFRQDLDGLRELAPNAERVNFYGATETPQAMGVYTVGEGERRDTVPVGRGITDAQLLVLNPGGALAGVGEKGEICVRTPYLTRGYLDDRELTRKRFRLNPFTGIAGDRIYKTGDLGRFLPDGNVEFLGRAARQVRLRG